MSPALQTGARIARDYFRAPFFQNRRCHSMTGGPSDQARHALAADSFGSRSCWALSVQAWARAIAVIVVAVSCRARAQDPDDAVPDAVSGRPTAALFATAGALDADAALDSALQAALDKLGVVRVTVRPGLDLEAVQLAIDCVGESAACLHSVAAQSGVDMLIAPRLDRRGGVLAFTLLRFDARAETEGALPERVVRRQPGSTLQAALLDAIPGMLRELFGLAAVASDAPAPIAAPPLAASDATHAPSSAHPLELPIGPIVLGGVGVLAIGGGIAAGLLSRSTRADYSKFSPQTESEVSAAYDKRSSFRTQAVIANVLYGVGAAALTAGAIWLVIELSDSHDGRAPDTALLPTLGPGQLGVTWVHRGVSL
jgi:hypothetical protein